MISQAGNKGFTLIELIIVLMLIGLASSVILVSISNEFSKSVIKSETRKLYAALKHARETAISKHWEVTFETEEENGGYSVFSNKNNIFNRALPDSISIYSDEVVFYPIGDSTGGTISVEDEDGRKYKIVISNITGKAKIERVQSP